MALKLTAVISALALVGGVWSNPNRRDLSQVVYNCPKDFGYTFDDGPWIYHQLIIDAFDEARAKTTFFMNGNLYGCIYDEDNVERLRATLRSGHLVAHHTWSHARLTDLTFDQIDVEIQRLDEAFIKILGLKPKLLRPPYGSIDNRTATYIQEKYGRTIVNWSDDSQDWNNGTPEQSYAFYKAFADAGPGQPHITLSHEPLNQTATSVQMGTVSLLADAGIKLRTVADCLGIEPYEWVGRPQRRDATWTCSGNWTVPTTTTSTVPTSTTTSKPCNTHTSRSVSKPRVHDIHRRQLEDEH